MKKIILTIVCIFMLCLIFVNACRKGSKDYAENNTVENQSTEENGTTYIQGEKQVSEKALKAREELLTEVGVFNESSEDDYEKSRSSKNEGAEKTEGNHSDNHTNINEDKHSDTLQELSDVPSGF